jgi:hypothetical protein
MVHHLMICIIIWLNRKLFYYIFSKINPWFLNFQFSIFNTQVYFEISEFTILFFHIFILLFFSYTNFGPYKLFHYSFSHSITFSVLQSFNHFVIVLDISLSFELFCYSFSHPIAFLVI